MLTLSTYTTLSLAALKTQVGLYAQRYPEDEKLISREYQGVLNMYKEMQEKGLGYEPVFRELIDNHISEFKGNLVELLQYNDERRRARGSFRP